MVFGEDKRDVSSKWSMGDACDNSGDSSKSQFGISTCFPHVNHTCSRSLREETELGMLAPISDTAKGRLLVLSCSALEEG